MAKTATPSKPLTKTELLTNIAATTELPKTQVAGRSNRRVVADADAILRWAATRANLDLLATCASYVPSSSAGAGVASSGRSARPSDLRSLWGREVE